MAATEKPKVDNPIHPTVKQVIAFNLLMASLKNATPTTMGEILVNAGFSESTSESPTLVTESKGFLALLEKYLPDESLLKKHQEQLNATGIEHMVFPLSISDDEITDLLKTVNCVTKKFMHSDTQTHVWFWASDNKAIQGALDMAYKLHHHYKSENSSDDEESAKKIGEFFERAAKLLP